MASDHRQRQCFYRHGRQEVDPAIWKACAGSVIHVPTVNSRVYYFPQGHIEQASSTVSLSSMAVRHSVLCRVLNVSFLTDVDTDEVFVKFLLEPLRNGFCGGAGSGSGGETDVVSFAKVLTQSDANNGGGFSVPRFCADSVFPPLNFAVDPPAQDLIIRDFHGNEYKFRHIYRGTPRRHLLTTGWSKFVNGKRLIAGDSVVFIRNKVSDELFVGIRRAFKMMKAPASSDSVGFVPRSAQLGGFSRSNRGRVPAEKVVEAVERSMSELAFEVVYYPRAGLPECVVAAEKVEVACGVYWSVGMRVKLAQKTEDGARLTWYNGTVESLVSQSQQWLGSPWRMLQVNWDEPEILQNLKTVNPWQLEFSDPTPHIHPTFPPSKKFKGDGVGDPPLPSIGFSSMMGQFSPSYLNLNTFPVGMQGARQIPYILATNLPNIMNDGNHQGGILDNNMNSSLEKMKAVSTDLNIGSLSPETPSPDSQNTVQLTNKRVTSFQLFGKLIKMASDIGSRVYDSSTTDTVEDSSSEASKSSDS